MTYRCGTCGAPITWDRPAVAWRDAEGRSTCGLDPAGEGHAPAGTPVPRSRDADDEDPILYPPLPPRDGIGVAVLVGDSASWRSVWCRYCGRVIVVDPHLRTPGSAWSLAAAGDEEDPTACLTTAPGHAPQRPERVQNPDRPGY